MCYDHVGLRRTEKGVVTGASKLSNSANQKCFLENFSNRGRGTLLYLSAFALPSEPDDHPSESWEKEPKNTSGAQNLDSLKNMRGIRKVEIQEALDGFASPFKMDRGKLRRGYNQAQKMQKSYFLKRYAFQEDML